MMNTMSESPDLPEVTPRAGSVDGASWEEAHDPLLEVLYPQRPWRRRAAEFLANLVRGAVVFVVAGGVLWGAYRVVVAPAWGKLRIVFEFEGRHSAADLREDLAFLRSNLEEKHPRLTAYQTEEEVDAAFSEAAGRLHDGMTTAEFLAVAAPLVTAVGCGHTGLRAPPGLHLAVLEGGRLMPLGVRFIGDRVFVASHYAGDVPVPLGSELTAINGRAMSAIRDRLLSCLPSDGRRPTYNVAGLERLFCYHYWVFVERPSRFRIAFVDPGGARRECTLRARSARSIVRSLRRQDPELDPLASPPRMRFEILEQAGVGYLRLATFAPEHRPSSEERLQGFFGRLAAVGAHTLILDVRGNAGGPPPVSVDLLRYLMSSSFVYLGDTPRSLDRVSWYEGYHVPIEPHRDLHFDGRLYVLIDHGSFSTTGHFLAHLRAGSDAVFVGQESGGGALCNDASEHLVLPHSRLRLRVATKTFVAGVDDGIVGGGVVPDIEVVPTIDDIVHHRDTVLARLGDMLDLDLEELGDPTSDPRSP